MAQHMPFMQIPAGWRGFSLVEMLMVVATVSILLLCGIGVFVLVQNGERGSRAERELSQIKDSIKKSYAASDYRGLDTSSAAGTGAFTGFKNVSETNPDHPQTPWGGSITVAMESQDMFFIRFEDIPRSACSSLATTPVQDADLISVQVGTQPVRETNRQTGDDSHATQDNLMRDCTNGSGRVTIEWIFR